MILLNLLLQLTKPETTSNKRKILPECIIPKRKCKGFPSKMRPLLRFTKLIALNKMKRKTLPKNQEGYH